jgi:hypothetical protein
MLRRPHGRRPTTRLTTPIGLLLTLVLGALTACSDGDPIATATTIPAPTAPVAVAVTTTIPETTTTESTTTTTTVPAPTTTTFPFVNQGAIVIVANAADVPGAGAEMTEALADYGFTMLPPTNGAGPEEIIEVTRIYARPEPEVQAVALSVARVMGELPVERMPTPAPIEGANETLADATILVMVGRDLAGRPLPGPPTP